MLAVAAVVLFDLRYLDEWSGGAIGPFTVGSGATPVVWSLVLAGGAAALMIAAAVRARS